MLAEGSKPQPTTNKSHFAKEYKVNLPLTLFGHSIPVNDTSIYLALLSTVAGHFASTRKIYNKV